MLYFSKLRVIFVLIFSVILSYIAFSNFIKLDDNFFSKNIKLGLDLQGGSYLLLQVDTNPIVTQYLQQKLIALSKSLKINKIKYQNLKLVNQSINFQIDAVDIEKFEEFLLNKDNPINIYYNQYRSYEMNHFFEGNNVKLQYSKFGMIEINNSALDQSLEIVRRRIDEIGTNEPTIIRRGSDRILVELPGLDDPN